MSKVYQQLNKIDLSGTISVGENGFMRASIEEVNTQTIRKGKRKMMTPLIAKYPVYGVINTNELVAPKGLDVVMDDIFSKKFHNFIKLTLCELMDDFGVITTTDTLYNTLQKTQQTLTNTAISIANLKKYMKYLKDANVYRKINNKCIVINPYQLYKDASIGGERLWQLQANWDVGKTMTHWLDLTTSERLELIKTKAELDKLWAEKELEELQIPEEKAKFMESHINELKKVIKGFTAYQSKNSLSLKNSTESFLEYISNDKGARHFVSWWNKAFTDKLEPYNLPFKLEYRERNKYCRFIITLLTKG